jgi:hypothetical protein
MKTENTGSETWGKRKEPSAAYGYDIDRIYAALREQGRQHTDRLGVTTEPRLLADTTAIRRMEPPRAG